MSNIWRDKREGEQHQILTAQHTVQHFCYSALLKVVKCQLLEKRNLTCLCHTRSCNLPCRHPHSSFRLTDHSFENTARDKGYTNAKLLSGGWKEEGLRVFSGHFLSFLPFCCSKQELNAKHVIENTQAKAVTGARLGECVSRHQMLHLMQPCACTSSVGAKSPWEQQLIHFAWNWSASCQLPRCPGLCTAVCAGSSCGCCSPALSGVRPFLPSHPFPLALRALGPAAQTPLCPSSPANPSPLPRIVFLASKLQRLIFCDRSNLLGKAEVHRESSPLNFPKPLQSIHNVALYWMQQRRKVSLKRQKKIYS